jgi:protein kinase C substrate 80K-H
MTILALYRSLLDHSNALKSLQREHKQHLEREKALGEILNTLRSGYNPNYQDMAVLEAVRGWEELAGLPHINDVRKDGDSADSKDDTQKSESEAKNGDGEEKQDDGVWSAEKLENELDGLVGTDYVSLLLEYEEHIRSPGDSEASICELCIPLATNGTNRMWCGSV